MQITLARIDDRLIHGQVTTVWSKVANAQRIIICNDDVFNDEVRRTLLRQAAPPGMKVNVVGNDSNLLIVFYVQIVPDDFVMQLHR
ncbi:PTS sugar transporter subunit IIB, partial [Klebsiella pneumoniae]